MRENSCSLGFPNQGYIVGWRIRERHLCAPLYRREHLALSRRRLCKHKSTIAHVRPWLRRSYGYSAPPGVQLGQLLKFLDYLPTAERAGAPMKKGRAQSCDRVRDPSNRICPYGEACLSTPNELCNKYKSLYWATITKMPHASTTNDKDVAGIM